MKYYLSLISLFVASLLIFYSFSTFGEEDIRLPVIMYHSVLKDASKTGKYVISPSLIEEDLDYLKKNGYETVTVSDLVKYVEGDGVLPKKPIMITFDDGLYNNLLYVTPLLKKYNMKAVISVVGKYSDDFSEKNEKNANYSHITWEDMKIANEEGFFEIQNHSYDMHKIDKGRRGCSKKSWEDSEEYRKIFMSDTKRLQNKLSEIGINPMCYTYPYGYYCNESEDLIKEMGFKASLSCVEGVNNITDNPDCLYLLKRYNRPGGIPSSTFFDGKLE